ncbi:MULTISPECIES: response regulator transcription factor [unclassified Oceanobacter]|uniref:response regulator transcription factor n=1 Tax=unclassified Oceanobacter TaxID=2620260 RepID=UPI0026E1F811|nr:MULTISPECIES: response regulator transcription factor [unclassified Oceanobacter]MDO6683196.1 response regulator transcription factor [Oceanobacter sp. 5_MG-2023]MDP2610571.1 response regulator transcription factor [Oceanobacter sp. 1_MG-2023]MDP2610646.1 response regulator transcription factor [Oceanobacter sp. 2_MG-2023]
MNTTRARPPIRLLIADDHPMVREGLKVSLESEHLIEVLADVSNGQQALEQAALLGPDVVLLDISMPVMGGLEACESFRQRFPEIRLLIVTMHDNREYILKAVQAGAAGYVLKDVPTEELLLAVQTVFQGGTYFSSSVAKTLFSEFGTAPARNTNSQGHQALSPRETDVLSLLTEGMGNKEIAGQLNISVRTVEAHRLKIKQKLGINNSAGLIRYALDNGIGKPV